MYKHAHKIVLSIVLLIGIVLTGCPETSVSETAQITFTGARNEVTSKEYSVGEAITLEKPEQERPGYEFTGWNTQEDGSGTSYLAGSTLTVTADLRLYAQWKPASYTITFDGNGATSTAPDPMTGDYDTTITLPAAPTRTGYTFTEWNTEQVGTEDGKVDASYTITGNATLYAQWTLASYTITFDGNGATFNGNGADSSPTQEIKGGHGTSITLPTAPTRTGYTFTGWNTEQGGRTGTRYDAKASYTIKGNVTLYARWSPISYTITFDGNEATSTVPGIMTGDYDTSITLPPAPSRTGYTFTGWNTEQGGRTGTRYAAKASYTIKGNVTLYARWSPISYTITFDGNEATSTVPDPETGDYDTSITLPPAPSRTGYTFTGWNTEQGGRTGTRYAAKASYTIKGNVTLYARWSPISYTITFDGNEATSTVPDPETGDYDTSITLPPAPSRTGYTFTGWNTEQGGRTGTRYAAKASYTIKGNVTLYARWSPISYTITFDGNEATSTVPDPETGDYDTSITLPPAPSRTGYTFTGWNTEQGGRTGTRYAAKASYTIKGNVTLYARWSPISYTITFDGNEATSTVPDPETGDYDTSITLPPAPSRTGYTFTGWNTEQGGRTGTRYAAKASYTIKGNVTLYARWSPISYTITFDGNEATSTVPDPETGDYDTSITLPPAPSRTGYTFTGWNTEQGGRTGTRYAAKASYTIKGNVTLYARWSPISYTITFDGNEATSTVPDPETGDYDTSITLPPAPSRTGYTFTGWNTEQGGRTGTRYAAKASYTIKGNVTLYARWSPISYTITFDGNEATSTVPDPETGDYDTSITLPPAPSRTGYTFTGWNTEQGGRTGTRYAAKASYTIKGNATLYARWSTNSYIVTFEGNGATSTVPGIMTGNYNTVINLPTAPSRTGYTFTGWNTEQVGTKDGKVGASYTITGHATLYAQWAKSIIITFDTNGATSGSSFTKTYAEGATIKIPANDGVTTISRNNYRFKEWNTKQLGGDDTSYQVDDLYTVTTPITFYIIWEPISYTIYFNGNGEGASTTPSITGNYNTVINLPPAPSRTGYTFTGWNTEQVGTKDGKVGASYTITGNATLYAQWTAKSYTITFDGNGATSTVPDPETGDYDTSINLPTAPSRTGHTFTGWNTEQVGTKDGKVGASYTITGNATLYAQWNPIRYTITFNANGARWGSTTRRQHDWGSKITLPTASRVAFSDDEKSFKGWSTELKGGTVRAAGTSHTVNGDVTFYAQWTEPVAITFNTNVDGSSFTKPSAKGATITLPYLNSGSTRISRTNYRFVEWNTKQDGTGTGYKPGDTYTVTTAITFYIIWEPISYTISFDGNGDGSSDTQSISGGHGTSITLPKAPWRPGYAFGKWNTQKNGRGQNYDARASYTIPLSDVTFYAQWKYTVTFDPNGGTGKAPGTRSGVTGTVITLPEGPTRLFEPQYSFSGWNTKADGSGKRYERGDTYTIQNNSITLYAQWTTPKYTVTYNPNGASGDPTESEIAYGTIITISTAPSRPGYFFMGWNERPDGKGNSYLAGKTFKVVYHTTFYAQWKRKPPYTVTGTIRPYLFHAFTKGSQFDMHLYKSYDGETFGRIAPKIYRDDDDGLTFRDPSVIQVAEDRFLMAYTNNVAASYDWTSKHFIIAESANGIEFDKSKKKKIDLKGTVDGINIDYVWAPEWFQDPADNAYYIIVTLGVKGSGGHSEGVFKTYLVPIDVDKVKKNGSVKVLVSKNTIDMFLVTQMITKNGQQKREYVGFIKDETTKQIEVVTASKVDGPYDYQKTGLWTTWPSWVEGASVYKKPNGQWRIIFDKYTSPIKYYYSDLTMNSDLWRPAGNDQNTNWSAIKEVQRGVSGTAAHGTVIRDIREFKQISPIVDTRVSFEASNFGNQYLRHQNSILKKTHISTAFDKSDATFIVRAALNGEDNMFSFESKNVTGAYIASDGTTAKIRTRPTSNTASFDNSASFYIRPGLNNSTDPKYISFETHDKGKFLVHDNGNAYIKTGDGTQRTYWKDGTWIIRHGLDE